MAADETVIESVEGIPALANVLSGLNPLEEELAEIDDPLVKPEEVF